MIVDLTGVELKQALSDFCTFLFTIPFFIKFVKELNSKIKEHNLGNKKETLELS
jgi:hypothetical protein